MLNRAVDLPMLSLPVLFEFNSLWTKFVSFGEGVFTHLLRPLPPHGNHSSSLLKK